MVQNINVGKLVVSQALATDKKYDYPLLLVHGSNGGSWYMENYLNYFAAAGWDSYAINLRGHYPSEFDPNLGKVTLEDYVDDVKMVMNELHIDNAVLIGHSMGGIISQRTASETPSVKGLITLCSAPPKGVKFTMPITLPIIWHTLKQSINMITKKPLAPTMQLAKTSVLNNLPESVHQEVFNKLVPEALVAAVQIGKGIPVDPSSIHCPILVVGAKRDALALEPMQQKIAAFYHADYKVYDQFAHFMMIEEGWEQSARDLADWITANVV